MKQTVVAGLGRSGISLIEIILASSILAFAIIPIMGLLGNSIGLTSKDERFNAMINICNEKLNTSLQFPYGFFTPAGNQLTQLGGPNSSPLPYIAPGGALSLQLGDETMGGFVFSTELEVEIIPVTFSFYPYDPTFRELERKRAASLGVAQDPANWGWPVSPVQPTLANKFSRYTMTIRWKEDTGKESFYAISSFKADIRR